jgi:hypothetical protein
MPRNPETWINPEGPGPVYADLVDLQRVEDGGRRIQVPAPGRQCVGWLKDAAAQFVLIELGDPGRIRLRPWKPFGEAVVNRQRELGAVGDAAGSDELLTLPERFRRVHFEKSGRFPLHEREQFHLGVSNESGWQVLLICLPNEIQLWSEQFRRAWRAGRRFTPPWESE